MSSSPTSSHIPSEADLASYSPTDLLVLSARLGRTDLAVSALRHGAPPNPPNESPLHIALSGAHVDVARALLAAGAHLSAREPHGTTALDVMADLPKVRDAIAMHVCQRAGADDVVAIRDALNAGWDCSVGEGGGALHWAATFGAVRVVKLLLEGGVPVNAINAKGETPLMEAARAGHVEVCRILVRTGADITLKSKAGEAASDMSKGDEVLGVLMGGRNIETDGVNEGKGLEEEARDNDPSTPYYVPGERLWGGSSDQPAWVRSLWPKCRRFAEVGGSFTLPPTVIVSVEGCCMNVGRMLVGWLRTELDSTEYSVRLVGGGHGGLAEAIAFKAIIFLRVDDYGVEGGLQGYRLSVRDFGIDVVGGGVPGVFYGCATLINVVRSRKDGVEDVSAPIVLPTFSVADWPAIQRRGLYLDIGGARIPRLKTLKDLVLYMAKEMKMNQLHLNVGANFARLEGLQNSRAISHEDLLELERICKTCFIELIPVIDSRQIAKTTLESLHVDSNGTNYQNSTNGKESLTRELLYDELLPLFSSEQVNLGELTHKAKCEFEDFEHLRSKEKSLRSRGKRTIHVFGNEIATALADPGSASGIIAELPTRCIFILQAAPDGLKKFKKNCQVLRSHGLAFYTCSSSGLERSIAGKASTSLQLSQTNISIGLEQGACGVLLKDVSAVTEGAPLVFLFQSLLPFAGAAWNGQDVIKCDSTGPEDILSQLYDSYIFRDHVAKGILGNISVSLGDLHKLAGDAGGVMLYNLLANPGGDVDNSIGGIGYLGLRKVLKRAERIEHALSSYEGNASATAVQELRVAAILLSVAARIGASLLSISSANSMDSTRGPSESSMEIQSLSDGRRSDICNALLQGIELMRSSWMDRYEAGGFTDTVQYITGETLSRLASGMPYEGYLTERKANGWAPSKEESGI